MNDLITRIVQAIFGQEGRPADHPNPGNLRDCPWFHGTYQQRWYVTPSTSPGNGTLSRVKFEGGFWVPRSRAEGVAGAAHVVALHIAEGATLAELITGWAPASDHNNTVVYIEHVSEWAAIPDVHVPLWQFLGV